MLTPLIIIAVISIFCIFDLNCVFIMVSITLQTEPDGLKYIRYVNGDITITFRNPEIRYNAATAVFTLLSPALTSGISFKRGDVSVPASVDDPDLLAQLEALILFPAQVATSPPVGGATLAEQQAQTLILEEIKDIITTDTAGLTWTKTIVPITTLNVDLLLANPNRKAAIINNRPGGAIVYFDISGGVCTTDDKRIPSNAYYVFTREDRPVNKVTGRRASGTSTVTVYEGV